MDISGTVGSDDRIGVLLSRRRTGRKVKSDTTSELVVSTVTFVVGRNSPVLVFHKVNGVLSWLRVITRISASSIQEVPFVQGVMCVLVSMSGAIVESLF